jgi:hypothetical protein
MNTRLLRKIHKTHSWKHIYGDMWVLFNEKKGTAIDISDHYFRWEITELCGFGFLSTYKYRARYSERSLLYERRKRYNEFK